MFNEVMNLGNLGQWKYYAEGGAHIVLKNIDGSHRRGLVKVPKKKEGTKYTAQQDVSFITHVLGKVFDRSYLPHSQEMFIDDEFLLAMQSSLAEVREPSRIKADPYISLSNYAILESDLSLPLIEGKPCISLEFKIKSSVTSTSPLVVHAHKLSCAKYSYMQQYKHVCHSNLPWGVLQSISRYDPHRLCSGQYGDFKESFNALLENPQNNLKVLVNDAHVYGWSKNCASNKRSMEDELVSILGQSCSTDTLTYIVHSILAHEPILPKLEQFQCLDVLDTEGCDVVYRLLEDIYQDKLLEILVDFFSQSLASAQIDMWNRVSEFIHNYTFNRDCASSVELDLDDPIQLLASIRIHKEMTILEVGQHRDRFMEVLRSLDSSQLMMLLKMAMVAMICKDASVIVAFSVSCINLFPPLPLDTVGHSATCQSSALRQSIEEEGELRVFNTCTHQEVMKIKYRVGMIDLQLKDISKFTSNIKKEVKIFQALSSHEL